MSLQKYKEKRNFSKTTEPSGKISKTEKERVFVVQFHRASHDHYDFRLQWRGVLLSWAVPKGPSMDPTQKRLAIQVEDHPLDYATFEGVIPAGQYGAGSVMIWDYGNWQSVGNFDDGLRNGSVKFTLFGSRLNGNFALVKIEKSNWLLIKENDKFVNRNFQIQNFGTSIFSGRTSQEILENKHPKKQKSQKNAEKSEEKAEKTKKTFDLIKNDCKPQLAKLVQDVPEKEWFFEVKFDGYRALAFVQNGTCQLLSRNKKDFSKRFSQISKSLADFLNDKTCILDGELIYVDKNGKSSFQDLQNVLRSKSEENVVYMIFDVLFLEEDIRQQPLEQRKKILKNLLEKSPYNIIFCEHTVGNGKKCFEAAKKLELEGIIAKNPESEYVGGRSEEWLKIKCRKNDEFVIGGYTTKNKQISALLVGAFDGNGKLLFCGRVGTGVNEKEEKFLLQEFEKILSSRCSFLEEIKAEKEEKLFWLKPKLVVQVEYAQLTKSHLLRQASFKGLREDKNAKEILFENLVESGTKIKKNSSKIVEKSEKIKNLVEKRQKNNKKKQNFEKITNSYVFEQVKISSPERKIFHTKNITKQDVANYYKQVSERMFPFLNKRPISVLRAHEGLNTFFKKHQNTEVFGEKNFLVKGEEKPYFYICEKVGILSEVQLGTLEFHMWGATADKLERPDFMVFDLDPDEKMNLSDVCKGVLELKSLLDELGLQSFLKTSGGKGYHVCLPFVRSVGWKKFYFFAENVAKLLERKNPEFYTTNMRKDARNGKIFVDYLRNGKGATSVAPYSLRARESASISWPIFWSELGKIAPNAITIQNFQQKLLDKDPWAEIFEVKQKLK